MNLENLELATPEEELDNGGAGPQEVLEKTEQGLRILSSLWGDRLSILEQYYGARNRKRFVPFKSEVTIQSEIAEILQELSPINEREEKVAEILTHGAIAGAEVLEKFKLSPTEARQGDQEEQEAIDEFNNKISSVEKIIQTYNRLATTHQDILALEREIIESPDEAKFDLYLKKITSFISEFEHLDDEEIEGLKKYFGAIDQDLNLVKETRGQNKPLEHLKQSLVSAVVRVGVANIVAGLVVGNPFQNPYFWRLSAATIPSVLAINYIDYYFKVFTKLTQRLGKFL